MSNQAYLSVWCKDFPEDQILERFGAFLSTVPYSQSKPGFTHLIVRALDFTQTALLEEDLRAAPQDAAGIIEIAKDQLHADCAYEVRADWDLWIFEGEPPRWQRLPQPLWLSCYGPDFDEGYWQENGHLEANLGFEHLFTGHGGLLGFRQSGKPVPQSAEEARFFASMEQPANLEMYQEKTRENIRQLLEWIRHIEKALPVDRYRMWSEGEENFEARLEEILAAR